MADKIYTTLEQSQKLKDILPLDSADMVWFNLNEPEDDNAIYEEVPELLPYSSYLEEHPNDLPGWSATALLNAIQCDYTLEKREIEKGKFYYFIKIPLYDINVMAYSTISNAAYDVIVLLHKKYIL